MEVEFNPGPNLNAGNIQPVARQKNIQPPEETTMSIGRTQALEHTLQSTPQIRPEAVARAGALVADENYPSSEVMDKLAGHLAQRLGSDSQQD